MAQPAQGAAPRIVSSTSNLMTDFEWVEMRFLPREIRSEMVADQPSGNKIISVNGWLMLPGDSSYPSTARQLAGEF